MKILFISTMPKRGISGGRLLASLSAESLARKGAEVTYLVDRINFNIFDKKIIKNIKIRGYLTFIYGKNSFLDKLILIFIKKVFKKKFDICIVVPQLGSEIKMKSLIDLGFDLSKKVYLLNFETPNWFNKYSPNKKSPNLWDSWIYAADKGAGIICISKESSYWAKKFYKNSTKIFDVDIPVYQLSDVQDLSEIRKNSVLCITRFDFHKGMEGLSEMIANSDGLDEFILVLGSVAPPEQLINNLKKTCNKKNVILTIKRAISHIEKYKILKTSKVLVFPTYFEGLGMPPIEALASGLSVVAFKLPVLKEISEKIKFVNPGDYAALGKEISNSLKADGGDEKIDRYSIENSNLHHRLISE